MKKMNCLLVYNGPKRALFHQCWETSQTASHLYLFFFSEPPVLSLMATCEKPETGGIFLCSLNIWNLCLQEPCDSYPEVLHLLSRPRKWTHLWADLCRYVLVRRTVNAQLIHRRYACSQSEAKIDVWKDTLLSLVSFALDLIICYHLLPPDITFSTAISYPVFLVDLADKYYCHFPWFQQILVHHSFDRHTVGL